MNHAQFWGGAAAAPYEIEQSLRFRGTAEVSRGVSSLSANTTFSAWFKLGHSTNDFHLLNFDQSGTNRLQVKIEVSAGGFIRACTQGSCSNSSALFRDYSGWYHVVIQTTSSATNIYVNNVLALTRSQPASGTNGLVIKTGFSTSDSSGYVAEAYFVDGSALAPTTFAEYDDNGVWRPIEVTGLTYGTNGFYLKFDPSATNGIGHDYSGNGNNYNVSGFTTSGTGTDVMSDTPTTNWCTLNPLSLRASYNNDCNDGNLGIEAVGGNWDRGTKGTIGASSGKWYWEYTHGTIASGYPQADIGVTKYASEINHYNNGGSGSSDTYLIQGNNGNKYTNGSGSSYGSSFTTGDTCNIALDLDNGKVWFGKNGTWFNSGDPAAGTNEAFSGLSGTFWPLFYWGISAGTSGINQAYFNFGQRAFEYTVPTGFLPLNTSNLPAPDIADGSDYFQTDLDTGANILSSAQGIFSNGLWWIKDRANLNQHQFVDSVRGGSLTLTSPNVQAETSYSTPSGNSVAWAWNTGTGTTTNTAGSIQSTVSANASAGFSIVSADTASSVTTATYGHGLGVAPSFMLVRPREGGAYHFFTYHKDIGAGKYIFLNSSAAPTTSSTIWNNTAPSSTVFTLGTLLPTDQGTSQGFIAYCFAEVEGYSKFGSYQGNSNSDGPFIYTGFRVEWLLVRPTISSDWIMLDAERNLYNPTENIFYASRDREEIVSTAAHTDFLSNGFKLRSTWSGTNQSNTYIYAAFAENPFGGSGVSPATAR